jgi:hypothetical protein
MLLESFSEGFLALSERLINLSLVNLTFRTTMESKQMKLSKETRFYYLDYLQKKLNQKVRGQDLSLSALDNMLYMIMELKKEDQ